MAAMTQAAALHKKKLPGHVIRSLVFLLIVNIVKLQFVEYSLFIILVICLPEVHTSQTDCTGLLTDEVMFTRRYRKSRGRQRGRGRSNRKGLRGRGTSCIGSGKGLVTVPRSAH